MSFHSPHLLWLLVLLLVPLGARLFSDLQTKSANHSTAATSQNQSTASKPVGWPIILGVVGFILGVFALTGPHEIVQRERAEKIAHDVVVAVDLSGSMLMEDFERDGRRVNRLDASKHALTEYVTHRTEDSIGLVAFAGEATLFAKPSFQHESITTAVEQLVIGRLKDGTAMGDALILALESLSKATGSERIRTILLLSDGGDNRSTVPPAEAAQRAAAQGVVIHTIGIGTKGIAPMPLFDQEGHKIAYRRVNSDFDETELSKVASTTGGRFIRATDSESLDRALSSIRTWQDDHIQKQTDMLVIEHAWKFALPGMVLLGAGLLQIALRNPKRNSSTS